MIYLDTSAMVKLVVAEPESEELIDWLNERLTHAPIVTSIIGRVELHRAALRAGAEAMAAAREVLDGVDTLVLTEPIAALAGTMVPAELRTLDALHLATAEIHREGLTAICAYDRRLVDAARARKLPVVAPGVSV
ncbi:type II toxin-antitoxin system VapC family toxin [Mycolicibacterium austroafricanum]|uniref:type II toxin-antitoxin system VapC family toxin n=1 Tax=Mycolicibacterium austroafricanum TaxID=39687 RepID=UPI000685230A|nr:type II toxin-antitoxin system VapC family toxin [Mycolicibacterium austroafricanum]QZY47773.1 type II toxin-antitoxin system VapC family toxin [Mycolicibacterium austroafricanum]